jgi:hypothetical protein
MTTDSPGQPPAIEGERVARAGARWTREEEEQLVVEVRVGTTWRRSPGGTAGLGAGSSRGWSG